MRLGQLARSLQAEGDQELLLDEVIRAAVELVPGADHGSISRVVGRQVIPEHATGPLPVQIELAQTELGQGPCLDSFHDQVSVRLSDTATDQRWPQFSRRAHALGGAQHARDPALRQRRQPWRPQPVRRRTGRVRR